MWSGIGERSLTFKPSYHFPFSSFLWRELLSMCSCSFLFTLFKTTINLSYKNIINVKYMPHNLKVVLEVIHLLISGVFIFLFMKQIAQNSIWKLIFENVIYQCKRSSWKSSTSFQSGWDQMNKLAMSSNKCPWNSFLFKSLLVFFTAMVHT